MVPCRECGAEARRIRDVGNPWLDAGIVPFSTLHYRTDHAYWQKWFPADFITESFPGQFRNWFYSMLAMGTVLRNEPPFKAIFGYATLYGEDGRPMHKSWGNAIEFNEAAERMGVDVMRWMYASARPEDNILFGYHTADEARRELLVLWNVLAFFTTYARLAGWQPTRDVVGAQAPDPARRLLDRWILSRAAGMAEQAGAALAEYDTRTATRAISTFVDDLSTWWLRRSRRRLSRSGDAADQAAAFGTLHLALVSVARTMAPLLPFLAEEFHQVLVAPAPAWRARVGAPDALAGGRPGGPARPAPGDCHGRPAPGRGAGTHAARPSRGARPPAARQALAGHARRRARRRPAGRRRRRAAGPPGRRAQRLERRDHR